MRCIPVTVRVSAFFALPAALVPACASIAAAKEIRLGTHLIFSQPTLALETATERGRVDYTPDHESRPGVEIRYGNLGMAVSIPASGADWTRQGVPEAGGLNDFRTYYHGDAWGVEANHRHARGFSSRTEFGLVNARHPGMTLRTSGATVYHALDPDSRVQHLSDGLLETGGSIDFFLMLGAAHSRLRDEESLLRGVSRHESAFDLRRIDIASMAFGAGYAISSNLHGLYFDQALFAGYGPQIRTWDDKTDWAWNLVKVNLRARLGFRTRWFDAGAGFENEAHTARTGEERMIVNGLTAQARVDVFL